MTCADEQSNLWPGNDMQWLLESSLTDGQLPLLGASKVSKPTTLHRLLLQSIVKCIIICIIYTIQCTFYLFNTQQLLSNTHNTRPGSSVTPYMSLSSPEVATEADTPSSAAPDKPLMPKLLTRAAKTLCHELAVSRVTAVASTTITCRE